MYVATLLTGFSKFDEGKRISFNEYGAIIWLPKSKTVRREIRIVYSACTE